MHARAGEPPWLALTLRWVRAHGRRFYNFDGLDAFKAKLRPEAWEGIYAISAERRFSPRTLHAIAADDPAVSTGMPSSSRSPMCTRCSSPAQQGPRRHLTLGRVLAVGRARRAARHGG